mmetsp:Transcript_81139/g.233168  ORF Transcript_81139/g.233168 Transcript_81139/m.233168 type:complete len:299 (-) Transcript_81139:13-909(-)
MLTWPPGDAVLRAALAQAIEVVVLLQIAPAGLPGQVGPRSANIADRKLVIESHSASGLDRQQAIASIPSPSCSAAACAAMVEEGDPVEDGVGRGRRPRLQIRDLEGVARQPGGEAVEGPGQAVGAAAWRKGAAAAAGSQLDEVPRGDDGQLGRRLVRRGALAAELQEPPPRLLRERLEALGQRNRQLRRRQAVHGHAVLPGAIGTDTLELGPQGGAPGRVPRRVDQQERRLLKYQLFLREASARQSVGAAPVVILQHARLKQRPYVLRPTGSNEGHRTLLPPPGPTAIAHRGAGMGRV